MPKDLLNTAFAALLQNIRPPEQTPPELAMADQMAAAGIPAAGKQRQLRSIFDRLAKQKASGQDHLLPLKKLLSYL